MKWSRNVKSTCCMHYFLYDTYLTTSFLPLHHCIVVRAVALLKGNGGGNLPQVALRKREEQTVNSPLHRRTCSSVAKGKWRGGTCRRWALFGKERNRIVNSPHRTVTQYKGNGGDPPRWHLQRGNVNLTPPHRRAQWRC
ncbi:hypothetical protein AVEN_102877-1 [Araneus ventricosus]|uniref:Uncharacterized protein n=1 Tax=Araneus ventricosus TaxID=182803 RepID=A0A4Y2PRK8_ARAVE|nr:hypothetical protein AVEN_102877-1 [Araneus ventricosus]